MHTYRLVEKKERFFEGCMTVLVLVCRKGRLAQGMVRGQWVVVVGQRGEVIGETLGRRGGSGIGDRYGLCI